MLRGHAPVAALCALAVTAGTATALFSLPLVPLGLALAGPAADAFGTDRMLIVCATLIVTATLAALLSPGVRSLRAAPAANQPELLEATTAS